MDLRLSFIGLLVGLLVGFSGIGGSSFMTPLLILVLGVTPLVAVGTDRVYGVPTKLVGAFVHNRQGTVHKRVVISLCLGAIPAAIVGVSAVWLVRAHVNTEMLNTLTKRVVAVVLLLAAVGMIGTPVMLRRKAALATSQSAPASLSRMPKRRLVALGALVGVIVSWTSIGSGAVTLPQLGLLAPRLQLRYRVGSDIGFAAFLLPVAAAAQLGMGNVNLPMSASLLVGSIPGVLVGSKLCKYVPEIWLLPTLAGVLVLAASRLV